MNIANVVGLAVWFALSLAGAVAWWLAERSGRSIFVRGPRLVALLLGEVAGTAVVAVLIALGGPVDAMWRWIGIGIAAVAAVVSGAVVTLAILALSDSTAAPPAGTARTVLRGGAWIGALERIGLLGSLLAGSAEGIVAIIAIKSLARYPELKVGQSTGASERFIIGTFTSLGWAAVCAGIAQLLR